jgi:hypothetical protein
VGEAGQRGDSRRRRAPRVLRAAVVVLLCALAAITLGFLAPLLIPLGLLTLVLVLVDPSGLGSKLRRSPGWWGFPGLRRASRGAVSFAGLLACYTVVVPAFALGSIVLVIATHHPATPVVAASGSPGGAVSPGQGTPTGTPGSADQSFPAGSGPPHSSGVDVAGAPAASSSATSATPRATATASPASPPSPSATPPPSLCGAPSNPWGYNLCPSGPYIYPPLPATFCKYFTCVSDFSSGSGYVVECSSGLYALSDDAHQQCGKVLRPLYA